jgi:UDP-N-acetylglucosamine--N-acetylmuramyl-(pentapeptide) pyrophosphoryl-undecaprenol N-acetylglucosamine transferase
VTGVSRHYVLAAGGTGGHLTPAFALAQELEARGHHVALVTDERGAKIPGRPESLTAHVIPAGRMGKNPLKWPGAISATLEGRRMALRLFESFEPSAVVGFGGYPALPALLAASSAGIPSVIHEQNAVLGRVNRFLAGKVNAIATSYPDIARLKEKHRSKVELVGNPVRAQILALRNEPFPAFRDDGLLRVLIIGGSQGASILSRIVPDGLAMLQPALRSRLQVTQQCRAEDLDAVRERYAGHDIPAELGTYFEDIDARLADAHLVIARAGASTVAELTVVGRPAILVPLAIATDDHQAANACDMVKAGGGRSIREHNFSGKELAKQIQAMAQHPETLANAAHAAWNCGRPEAAEKLADLVESFGRAPLMDVIRMGGDAEKSTRGREALARERS